MILRMHCLWKSGKEGAAMVESCLVIIMLCIILFGFLQLSHVIMAGNVLRYAALTTARAASVGLHEGMQERVGWYASIPTAGAITTPEPGSAIRLEYLTIGEKMEKSISRQYSPESSQGYYEVFMKSEFHMADENEYQSILDYANWESGTGARTEFDTNSESDLIDTSVRQYLPLTFPFAALFSQHLNETAVVDGEVYPAFYMEFNATIEDHAAYYLDGEM